MGAPIIPGQTFAGQRQDAVFDPWKQGSITEDLDHLLQRSFFIREIYKQKNSSYDISFTSTFLAFLISDDRISKWFNVYLPRIIDVSNILKSKGLDYSKLENAKEKSFFPWRLSNLRLTSAANRMIEAATRFMYKTSKQETKLLDVRHLMGAYIYDPPEDDAHKELIKNWGLVDEKYINWSNAFLSRLSFVYPDEVNLWKNIHREKFKQEPEPELSPSTRVATDRYTLEDKLGYSDYAHAIARFLTDKQTMAPLSVSIQAPWGGGKTSLMRMVQKELDQEAEYVTSDINPIFELRRKSVKDFLKMLNEMAEKVKEQTFKVIPIHSSEKNVKPRMTIWFNAWKYESTEQVWAGLVDCIVKQTVQRLEPEDRERFLLELHLRRQNMGIIRRRIYDYALRSWWQKSRPWIWKSLTGIGISALITIIGLEATDKFVNQIIGAGGIGGIILSTLAGILPSIQQKQKVEKEPAEMIVGEYANMPDYSTNLSFIHYVEEDLRRVFEIIPRGKDSQEGDHQNNGYLPMVIFVDDLDRCSVDKIVHVIEGVNLFLAGDFNECIFVLGMDAAMVAAALEDAHSKVIDKLPSYSKEVPIGWRFMDKFVQLPIVIPPPEDENIRTFVRSLTLQNVEAQIDQNSLKEIAKGEEHILAKSFDSKQIANELAEKHGLGAKAIDNLEIAVKERMRFQAFDEESD